MNLYLISRIGSTNYDEYDAFVIRAPSPEEARDLAGMTAGYVCQEEGPDEEYLFWLKPENTRAEVLAFAVSGEPKVVLGSYNAG